MYRPNVRAGPVDPGGTIHPPEGGRNEKVDRAGSRPCTVPGRLRRTRRRRPEGRFRLCRSHRRPRLTYQHDQGRLAVEKALGNKVKTLYIEKVAEGPDTERAITRLARQGAGLIFTTSFGFMDPTIKVAKRFPKVMFEHATGYKRAKNVATYSSRFYEGRYVIGQIAAKLSKKGWRATSPRSRSPRWCAASTPSCSAPSPSTRLQGQDRVGELLVRPRQGGRRAQGPDRPGRGHHHPAHRLHRADADRRREGALAFGQASDMIKFGPKTQLTAIIDDWRPYYVQRTKAVLDGSWKSTDTWGGMDTGMVGMAPYTNMPADIAAMAKATEEKIRSGKMHVFAGPIHKQTAPWPWPRQEPRRRHAPWHELVRQGDRRQAAEVGDSLADTSGPSVPDCARPGRQWPVA